jgi:pyocin large subunit-like protein
MSNREISPNVLAIPSAAATLRAMAEAFLPALEELIDVRNEDGERRIALDLRELANAWDDILCVAEEIERQQKNLSLAS